LSQPSVISDLCVARIVRWSLRGSCDLKARELEWFANKGYRRGSKVENTDSPAPRGGITGGGKLFSGIATSLTTWEITIGILDGRASAMTVGTRGL
jgi:hypothetical protein